MPQVCTVHVKACVDQRLQPLRDAIAMEPLCFFNESL